MLETMARGAKAEEFRKIQNSVDEKDR